MKKIIALLSVFILLISSCSDEEQNNNNEETLTQDGTLVKRVVAQMGSNNSTADYTYFDGNKLQSIIINNGGKYLFSYSGNKIVEQKYYENNVLQTKESYQYDSQDRMTQRKSLNYINNKGYKADYVYNLDGTVNVTGFNGDFNVQNEQIVNNKVYLFSNGNVEKIEKFVEIGGAPHTKTTIYTYDDLNSVTNSIVGFNKIKLWDTGTSGNINNNLAILYSTTENSQTYSDNMSYTYNSHGFPKTVMFSSVSTQYYYQQ